jgi:protein-tyrosine phosphatase
MMTAQPSTAILFVCLGNICRSPLAEGVFRNVVTKRGTASGFHIDSAGTGAWHQGSAPDPRSIQVAARHGIDIVMQRARRVRVEDFSRFDLILGMDVSNVEALREAAPAATRDRIHLFLDYATGKSAEVPDPYYGGPDGFLSVYRMIREASELLADRLAARASAPTSGHASSTI